MTDVIRLIEALRSLPEGFCWDFEGYETCALGVAVEIGLLTPAQAIFAEDVEAAFGIDLDEGNPFSVNEVDGLVPLYGVAARDVSPAMVADALEALVGREG